MHLDTATAATRIQIIRLRLGILVGEVDIYLPKKIKQNKLD